MKRVLVGMAIFYLAVAAIVGAWFWWDRRPSGMPPIDGGLPIGGGQLIGVGQPYAWGTVLLTNLGDRPVVVERARVLRSSPDIELLGEVRSHRVGEGPGESQLIIGELDGFPTSPSSITRPLREQNVVPVPRTFTPDGSPHQGLQLVFGIRLTTPGMGGLSDVEVTFRVGKRRYRQVYDHSLFLCAPVEAYSSGECPPRGTDDEEQARLRERPLG